MLYGAILGDIIGSPYEFDTGMKTKEFPLFSRISQFTDDSVMTVGVAKALLLLDGKDDIEDFRDYVIMMMRQKGREYPYIGYGERFYDWLYMENPQPYGSWGNGSAMRVSAIGWAFDSIEKTREYARVSAEVSHNHPEGIKGAEATAAAIFLARTGHTKAQIKEYIESEFGYDLNRKLDDIRPVYTMDESCQGTVPEAIIGFLEATDFEDTLRNVISLGGDADTIGAIAGSIAEAYFGIPEALIEKCRENLDEFLLKEIDQFINYYTV